MRIIAAVGTVALVTLLAGCSNSHPDPSPTPTISSTWHAPARTADNTLQWDEHVDAIEDATEAMTAFIDHSLPAAEWWIAFEPYLTSEAKYVWRGTDPRNIPATQLTGAATVVGEATATRVELSVPTDAGIYQLTVIRHVSEGSEPGPWLVFTLVPPTSTKNVAIEAGKRPPMGEGTTVLAGAWESQVMRGED